MADNTSTNGIGYGVMLGRRNIYSSVDAITPENVVAEVNSALKFHFMNVSEMEYLYWYRRGLQPILQRTKERNSFVNNKIVENHAEEIVTFKNGFFLPEPAVFVARRAGAKSKVDKLNEYLYRSGKHIADNQLVDWFHTVGKAALYIEPTPDEDVPVVAYALDPRSAFVVYSLRPGNAPLYAVNIVKDGDIAKIDVWTKENVYRLVGGAEPVQATSYPVYEATAVSVVAVEENRIKHIPIIEYRYNSINTAAFEQVTWLLDAINTIQSNRVDGIEQFIQSIAVAVNCQFEDDVTANKIREAGMIALKSVGENKADFKILSEELNQEQTQKLVDDLYDQALRICSMPTTTKGGKSTSDTGVATIYRDGWEQAAGAARNTEDLFKESDKLFEEIFCDILRAKNLLNVKPMIDFELHFVRNETANVQSKAQALNTMLASGIHPILALSKSGISSDPVGDYTMSEKYIRMIWGDPDKADKVEEQTTGQGEAKIVEQDNNNGENATGGDF